MQKAKNAINIFKNSSGKHCILQLLCIQVFLVGIGIGICIGIGIGNGIWKSRVNQDDNKANCTVKPENQSTESM